MALVVCGGIRVVGGGGGGGEVWRHLGSCPSHRGCDSASLITCRASHLYITRHRHKTLDAGNDERVLGKTTVGPVCVHAPQARTSRPPGEVRTVAVEEEVEVGWWCRECWWRQGSVGGDGS